MRTALAGLVGAFLGGIAALSLVFIWGVGGWIPWLLIGLGAVAGWLYGDRGIGAVARVVGWI